METLKTPSYKKVLPQCGDAEASCWIFSERDAFWAEQHTKCHSLCVSCPRNCAKESGLSFEIGAIGGFTSLSCPLFSKLLIYYVHEEEKKNAVFYQISALN